ncbi:hypothetical protein NM04_15085 [Massilia aurea]|uniref:Uncharacterized protein n=1 Tax=Massilia aurea TaxID=373040 RepID=A0A422QJ18_9BURK|nr:hypothetical protein NM04_15085 [Massilia aurea]
MCTHILAPIRVAPAVVIGLRARMQDWIVRILKDKYRQADLACRVMVSITLVVFRRARCRTILMT